VHGHALYVTQTSSELLELLHPEVSKGAALRCMGVAMGNASAEVKALADRITDSNEDDGIATALERLGAL
jgi:hydroxymethylpyrimidine pyrophosphatase-like HAD family hydrolase